MRLAIYGAGGLGKEIHMLADQINKIRHSWEEIIFIDDVTAEKEIKGCRVVNYNTFLNMLNTDECEAVIAQGEPYFRYALSEKIEKSGYNLAKLIHPDIFISDDTVVGKGSIISYGCFISCDVTIGKSVMIQPLSNIGHDTVIDDYSMISAYVNISGHCHIGERTYISPSVPIIDNISVGKDTIIGTGSVVFRDLPDNVVALGNPARPMKNNEEHRVFKK